MPFDNPNLTEGIAEIPKYANAVTDGLLGTILLLTVFLGLTLSIQGRFKERIIAASFITAISSMLFFLMGLVGEVQMIICIIAAAVSVVFGGE